MSTDNNQRNYDVGLILQRTRTGRLPMSAPAAEGWECGSDPLVGVRGAGELSAALHALAKVSDLDTTSVAFDFGKRTVYCGKVQVYMPVRSVWISLRNAIDFVSTLRNEELGEWRYGEEASALIIDKASVIPASFVEIDRGYATTYFRSQSCMMTETFDIRDCSNVACSSLAWALRDVRDGNRTLYANLGFLLGAELKI